MSVDEVPHLLPRRGAGVKAVGTLLLLWQRVLGAWAGILGPGSFRSPVSPHPLHSFCPWHR